MTMNDAGRRSAQPTAAAAPADALRAIEERHGAGLLKKRGANLLSGQGAWLTTTDGRRLLDFAVGHGVAALGHCHPHWVAAVQRQVAELTTCPDSFATPRRAELLQRLLPLLPGDFDRLFLCNSGTEAVEAALKFARGTSGRTGVVALNSGFHGRTLGALSATAKAQYRDPFLPLVPGFRHVSPGDPAAVEAAIDEQTACVILELVQGEGGVRPLERNLVERVRARCDATRALLVVDEVQTGFGRTGRLFACEHYGLRPDLLCLGKAIAGGLPMGALAFGPRVGTLPPSSHGTTFGGNPLVCAAALAVLDVFEREQLVARAERLGARARERLTNELSGPGSPLRELRGLGLMIGLELKFKVDGLLVRLLERGLVALAAGPNVLRLLPPLVTTDADLEHGLDLVVAALREEPAGGPG